MFFGERRYRVRIDKWNGVICASLRWNLSIQTDIFHCVLEKNVWVNVCSIALVFLSLLSINQMTSIWQNKIKYHRFSTSTVKSEFNFLYVTGWQFLVGLYNHGQNIGTFVQITQIRSEKKISIFDSFDGRWKVLLQVDFNFYAWYVSRIPNCWFCIEIH